MKISKSDYYRNEMDVTYEPGLGFQLGVNLGAIRYIPYQVRDSFASLFSYLNRGFSKKQRNFPIDDLADRLDPTTSQKREFWKKEFGVIMTHDVDTRLGYEFGLSKFVDIERKLDMTSTYNLVPKSNEYDLTREVVESLKEFGHDVGIHGLNHDGSFAYLPPSLQRERISEAASIGKDLHISLLGYRAPLLHRTKQMIRFLSEAGFQWDSSFPDTDDSTTGYESTGCRTIFPFYPLYFHENDWKHSNMLEIPVSMPQDWTLLYHYRMSEKSMMKVWMKKLNYIRSRGGLAVFVIHPDMEDFGHPKRHKAYRALLSAIIEQDPELLTCSGLTERWRRKFT